MIYYTSDLHFGYEAILQLAGRPFASVGKMDEALIANWNSTVTDDDTVYLLGDLGCHGQPIPERHLARLRGRKHLIRGNHDVGLDDQHKLFDYFESVTDFLEIDDGQTHVVLCHYPIVFFQKGYMIHGHFHTIRPDIYDLLKQMPRVLNAGVDINGFRPVTLKELIENNRVYYQDPTRGCREDGPSRSKGWKADFRPLPIKAPQEGSHDDRA